MSIATKLQIQKLNEEGLHKLKDKEVDKAIDCYNRILSLDESNDNALHMLAIAFNQMGQTEKACEYVVRAIKIYGWCADYYNTLAGLKLTLNKPEEALTSITAATQLNPDHAGAYNNLGMILMELGRHQEAVQAYERSIELNPQEPYVHHNYALSLLMLGDWDKGWEEYEWRLYGNELLSSKQPHHYALMAGTTALAVHEQGFGDTIHFCRYASEMAKHAKQVVICCPAPLVKLMNTCPGVTAQSNAEGEWNYVVPMMSLPRMWRQSMKKIPDFKPYLSVPPGDYSDIYEKMQDGRFKIGVVWGSRRDKDLNYDVSEGANEAVKILPSHRSLVHYSSHKRSFHPSLFEPLAYLPNVDLYSLQKGPDTEQLKECDFLITDLGSSFKDFSDTAAAIDKLDLVISIDTSVAHLAGAMGKRVWTLLPYSSEWRWGWNRTDTVWYPTMELYKQQTPGDWQGVLDGIHQQLAKEVIGCC